MRRLGLDRVWWLVGPGNPLKHRGRLPTVEARLLATSTVARHPRMETIDLEATLGFFFSVETVRYLVRTRPAVRFVWIIGADSFANFHRWRAWRDIAALVPIAVVDRPGWTLRAQRSRAAAALGPARLDSASAARLSDHAPPAWVFIGGPRSHLSSTSLRDKLAKNPDLR